MYVNFERKSYRKFLHLFSTSLKNIFFIYFANLLKIFEQFLSNKKSASNSWNWKIWCFCQKVHKFSETLRFEKLSQTCANWRQTSYTVLKVLSTHFSQICWQSCCTACNRKVSAVPAVRIPAVNVAVKSCLSNCFSIAPCTQAAENSWTVKVSVTCHAKRYPPNIIQYAQTNDKVLKNNLKKFRDFHKSFKPHTIFCCLKMLFVKIIESKLQLSLNFSRFYCFESKSLEMSLFKTNFKMFNWK